MEQAGKGVRSLDPRKSVFSLWEEFKSFAFKGNVIDLAVGVVIGAAFGKLVDSLVKNIIMPLTALVLPTGKEYESWTWTVGEQTVPYGLFIADVVNFVLVAFALFLFLKKFMRFLIKQKEKEVVAPAMTKDQQLLTEIRDLLLANRQT